MSFVLNQSAYDNAIARNIRFNAQKTRRNEWMKLEGGERARDFLFGIGEFEATYHEETGNFLEVHPVVKASCNNDFYFSMRDSANQYGGLTGKQNAAVLGVLARAEAKVAGFAAKRAAEAATSQWIGTVGKREMFTVTIRHIVEMDGIYGRSYIHIMNDAQGNVVIYKGTKLLGDRGETLTVKATCKEHGEREGVKQTKIARPA